MILTFLQSIQEHYPSKVSAMNSLFRMSNFLKFQVVPNDFADVQTSTQQLWQEINHDSEELNSWWTKQAKPRSLMADR